MNLIHEFDHSLGSDQLDFRIRRTLEYASRNLGSDLPLSRLATITGVSQWHLCRLFKAELGLPPGRCIKLLRLKLAADLLANTALSVKEVMAAVGIDDQSHFVRDFESIVGVSPRKYRIQVHKQNRAS
jgi:AraC family transcriptional regulator